MKVPGAGSEVVLLRVDLAAGAAVTHPRHRHPALDLKYVQSGFARLAGRLPPLVDAAATPLDVAQMVAAVRAYRPRIVVVKAASWCLDEAVAGARALRADGVLTIAVGQQTAHVARAPFPGWWEAFDIALRGDPEEVLPPLLVRLLENPDTAAEIAAWRERFDHGGEILTGDPDALPTPEFADAELRQFPFPFPLRAATCRRWGYVLTSWGCPRPCRHCSAVVRKSAGRTLRKRSPGQVVDEVEALLARGVRAIAFEDDSLLVDPRHFIALADEIVRRRLDFQWMANARPDELDAERIDAAAASGATLLKIGIDSGSPRMIERLGKASDGGEWIAAVESGLARVDSRGIGSVGLFMVGMPDESEAEIEMSIALAQRVLPDYIQVQIYCAYPDVPLWSELPVALRRGGAQYHYRVPLAQLSRIAPEALPRWQRQFYRRFYLRPAYVASHLGRCWRSYLQPQALIGSLQSLAFLLR